MKKNKRNRQHKMNQHKKKVIIAGGGTGGHIFPAIAIANQLKKMVPDIDILFVGAKDRMEMEKVPQAGYKIEGLWISGLQRNLSIQNLMFPLKVMDSILKSYKIIKRFKPDVVVGVGGYSSGPVLYVAGSMGIPTVIQEQNSYAGITNKLLSKSVKKVCVAYDNMESYFPPEKIVLTGNPVRSDMLEIQSKRAEAQKFFNLDPSKKTILAVGGSLGARSINNSIYNGLDKIREAGIQLIWQTGKSATDAMKEKAKTYNSDGIYAFEFINKMDMAYAAADVVISRAGAIAISELCIAGKAVVLVPFPYAAEDHQTKNALALVQNNAAILVKDNEAKDQLVNTTLQLMQNEEQQQEMSENIKKMARPEAVLKIAEEVLKLM